MTQPAGMASFERMLTALEQSFLSESKEIKSSQKHVNEHLNQVKETLSDHLREVQSSHGKGESKQLQKLLDDFIKSLEASAGKFENEAFQVLTNVTIRKPGKTAGVVDAHSQIRRGAAPIGEIHDPLARESDPTLRTLTILITSILSTLKAIKKGDVENTLGESKVSRLEQDLGMLLKKETTTQQKRALVESVNDAHDVLASYTQNADHSEVEQVAASDLQHKFEQLLDLIPIGSRKVGMSIDEKTKPSMLVKEDQEQDEEAFRTKGQASEIRQLFDRMRNAAELIHAKKRIISASEQQKAVQGLLQINTFWEAIEQFQQYLSALATDEELRTGRKVEGPGGSSQL